ncbi:hypothetical protein GIB67_029491 [Kingdonia uniflora]|uniref:Uncharacterized protein n=1 Tax=Kingdonia uniflora TaxID=39325 RepID=A0A7J7NYB9_9MAGN|nr:hypothetical protein GIB67_029491 [Kingdonia uniflora]
MPPISGIPSETSAMAIRYAYSALPSVPSLTSHTSSPSLSPLSTASGNSRPSRKKCDYCVCQILWPLVLSQDEISKFRQLLSISSTPATSHADNFASAKSVSASPTSHWIDSGATDNMTISPSVSRHLQVYTRRHPGRQSPTPDCQASSVAPGLPPAIDSPLSGIEPSPTASIPVTTDVDSPVSHSDNDRPIAIRKEKRPPNLRININRVHQRMVRPPTVSPEVNSTAISN